MMPATEVGNEIFNILKKTTIFVIFILAYLGKPLEDHVKKLKVAVTIFRSTKRIGLVKARLMGANAATGR